VPAGTLVSRLFSRCVLADRTNTKYSPRRWRCASRWRCPPALPSERFSPPRSFVPLHNLVCPIKSHTRGRHRTFFPPQITIPATSTAPGFAAHSPPEVFLPKVDPRPSPPGPYTKHPSTGFCRKCSPLFPPWGFPHPSRAENGGWWAVPRHRLFLSNAVRPLEIPRTSKKAWNSFPAAVSRFPGIIGFFRCLPTAWIAGGPGPNPDPRPPNLPEALGKKKDQMAGLIVKNPSTIRTSFVPLHPRAIPQTNRGAPRKGKSRKNLNEFRQGGE